ncbi:hypothetical protein ACUYQI_000522 [Salmonella enterica subsp. enterica serovar Braenderup]
MNFSTTTKSGMIQYAKIDPTKNIIVLEVEQNIIEKFNKKWKNKNIEVQKYSEHLPFAFVISATTTYSTVTGVKEQHPEYSEFVLCAGYLDGCADNFGLKCTRSGL